MDWDDDEFEIKLPPGAQPAASALSAAPEKTWEDEVDRALAPEAVAAVSASAPAKPEQVKAKHLLREKARKQEDERAADRAKQVVYSGPDDPGARRKWEEEQIQNADLAAAMDALAVSNAISAPPPPPGADISAYVDALPLSDVASFKEAGVKLAARICKDGITSGIRSSTEKALSFYRETLKSAAEKLTADDLKVLTDILDVFRNKKLQEAKAKKKGGSKAKSTGKHSLMVERDDDYMGLGDAEGGDLMSAYGGGGGGAPAPSPSPGPEGAAAGGADGAATGADGDAKVTTSWKVEEDFM